MSDPEDLQEGKRNMADWIFQLKRIGPPATCSKVPDSMRLNLGLTRVGRGQHNDYYLDSAVLKNFISRSHVEIFGKQNENGEIEFVLTDKGLNGTFINDIRTHKTCTIELGDKITFGHTNGYKIQPGSYAEQPSSEFQFVFEKIPSKSKTSEMFSESSPNTTPVEESSNQTDLKKDATIVSERLFKNNDIQSNVEQTPEKSAKSKSSHKGRNRKDSSSHSDNDLDLVSKNSSHQRGRRGSGKHNSDNFNKSPISELVNDSKRKVSTGSSKEMFSETLPAADDDEDDDDDGNDEEVKDDDNDDNEDEEIEEEEEEEEVPVKKRRGPKKGKTSAPKKSGGKKKVVEPPSESEESSEEDDSSKPEADQRPKTQAKQKAQQKKRRPGNDAPAVGSRKRRRKGGAASSSTASTSDNLEPGVEWYDDDTCDSADCKRPKKKRTPWVQCDDCDGWYHTVCVGANYKKLKDSDEHFNCGCD